MGADARDLQVHHIDVLRQGVLVPEGDALAVGARVVAQLQVHRVYVPIQVALLPEGDALAVDARVRPRLRDVWELRCTATCTRCLG